MSNSSEIENSSSSSPEGEAQDFSHLNENNFPIARYKPLKLLGKGATGAVYLCEDKKLEKEVALKTSHGLTASHLFDFQREARATSKLNHPNIVQIYDCGVTDSSIPFISMEPIGGKSLDAYLKEGIIFELDTILEIFIKVTEALSYAHENGIYHRDLKPANILILGDEENLDVKIIDFGVAYMAQVQEPTVIQGVTITGTPLYMSPDQVNNLPYNATSEVYSLGCILYEALTGKSPYEAPTSLELFSCHAMHEIPRLSDKSEIKYPEILEGLVAKCMAKTQSERFQSMREVRAALRRCLYVVENAEKESLNFSSEPETVQHLQPEKRLKVKNVILFALPVVIFVGLTLSFILSRVLNKVETNEQNQVTPEELPKSLEDFGDSWYMGKNDRGEDALFAKSGTTDSDLNALRYTAPIKLARIVIPYSSKITGTGFKSLHRQPIIGITFKNRSLTDDGLKEISRIDTLMGLVLILTNKVTDEGLRYLNGSSNLAFLYLGALKVEPNMISAISQNQKLKALGFMLCKITDPSALSKLGNLKGLEILEIPATGAEDIAFVKKLKSLRKLNLAFNKIDDKDLDNIVDLPLRELLIQNTKVSINGLIKLNKIKSLEKLTVSLGNGITRNSIKQNLKLPHCVVDIPKRKNSRRLPFHGRK